MTKIKRTSGRPSKNEQRDLNSDVILTTVLNLTKGIPLQNLSIAAAAREMHITPALIHYYIGSRDSLVSGVMNLFYKQLLDEWPIKKGPWQECLLDAGNHIYQFFVDFGGIAAYSASNSRFRVFQLKKSDTPDYGVMLLEKFTGCVRAAGLNGERTGIYAHLMMDLIVNTAHGTASHLFPGEYKTFLQEKTKALKTDDFPNIHFAMQSPLHLDGAVAFKEAFTLYLLGLEQELSRT